MANDIPEVYIRVVADTGEVQRNLTKAELAFLRFQKSTKKGRKSWGSGMAKDFAKMAGGIFAVERAMSMMSLAFKTMISDVSDMQRIRVELNVATGSAVLADKAFNSLKDTAKKLPSSLQDLTTGFIRLKNMGLDASEDSLISFSNTAAAMGKSLKQYVEAVADANTREFERLKEFGILARNQGDTIKFVFRGATTEVKNSSKDIVQFLTDIGNTDFAGAATDQIETIASRTTKLRDALFNLNVAAGEGVGGTYGELLNSLTEGLDKASIAAEDANFAESLNPTPEVMKNMGWFSRKLFEIMGLTASNEGLGIDQIREQFGKLGANELPAAIRMMEAFREHATKGTNTFSSMTAFKKFKAMQEGINFANRGVDLDVDSANYTQNTISGAAFDETLKQQRELVDLKRKEYKLDLDIDEAKRTEDIVKLQAHQVVLNEKLVKKQAEIKKGYDGKDGHFGSIAAINSLMSEENELLRDIRSLEVEVIDIRAAGVEAKAASDKAAKKVADDAIEDAKEYNAFIKDHGSIAAFNEKMAAERRLTTRVALSKEVALADALNDKKAELAGKIQDIQDKLAAKGLGFEEAEEFNSELESLTSNLDSVTLAIEDQKNQLTEWQEAMVDLFDDIKEGIAEAIIEGEGFKGLISSILKQIAKTQIIDMLGGLGGTPGSGIFSLFKRPKGAFTGGPVSSGVPRIVGEKGPEIFTPSEQEVQQMIASSVELSVNLAVTRNQDLKNRGSIR